MKATYIAIASLALVIACDPGLSPRATLGDTAPEKTLLGSEIADTFALEDGFYVSPVLEAPEGALRVGFFLDVAPDAAAASVALEARGLDANGEPGAWRPAFFTWVEHPMRVGRVDLGMNAYAVEVRVPPEALPALTHLTFNAVVPADETQDPGFDAFASRPVDVELAAAPRVQGLSLSTPEPRSAWGARPTNCSSVNAVKTKISVHHTVTPAGAGDYEARLRGIQAFHMDTRGWCDVGYHFLVTTDGTTWEGRPAGLLGAHVGGQNTNNLGVSFVGCFHSSQCADFPPNTPPDAMIQGGGTLIGEAAGHYGISVSSTTVIGHRDNPGQTTSCPGDHLHERLPDLRAVADGADVVPDPTEDPAEPAEPEEPEPTASLGVVQGVVWDLSVTDDPQEASGTDAILPGTTIACDCGMQTTARVDDAYWAFDLMPGVYQITATRDGYAPTTRTVHVTSGGSHWASIGVAPEEQVVLLNLTVRDIETGVALANAYLEVTGHDPTTADIDGQLTLPVVAGSVTIKAAAEGYAPATVVRDVSGASFDVTVQLEPAIGEEPADQGDGIAPPIDDDDVPLQEEDRVGALPPLETHGARDAGGSPSLAQACACVLSGDGDATDPQWAAALLPLALVFFRRRRR